MPDDPARPLLQLQGITRVYRVGQTQVRALDQVTFDVARGELLSIIGASGSGKSTLLAIIGCLDRPTAGRYVLDGDDVSQLDDTTLSAIRNRHIGFVFQSYHLIPSLTAQENVELPLFYRGWPARRRRERALESLAQLGLSDRVHHMPEELSGGQKQRVAIARALAGHPSLLLADEPTGNLDSVTGAETLELLLGISDRGTTVLLVTHDLEIAAQAPRRIRLSDGQITDEVAA